MEHKSILVVDDDPDIVDYFESLLEDHGYEVRTAQDARSALDLLVGYRPDVILIDALMPGRSGLDLLLTLRRSQHWAEIPLVVVTGNDRLLEDDCQSYLGAHEGVQGPDGVLGKPIDCDTLLNVVATLCNGGAVPEA